MDSSQETLLTFGYVRECCRKQNIDFFPDDIVGLLVVWLIFGDYFDKNLCHPLIDITNVDMKHQQASVSKKQNSIEWCSAVGRAIIRRGAKFEWQFEVNDDIISRKVEVQLGIIDNSVIKQGERIEDFAGHQWNGWAT